MSTQIHSNYYLTFLIPARNDIHEIYCIWHLFLGHHSIFALYIIYSHLSSVIFLSKVNPLWDLSFEMNAVSQFIRQLASLTFISLFFILILASHQYFRFTEQYQFNGAKYLGLFGFPQHRHRTFRRCTIFIYFFLF